MGISNSDNQISASNSIFGGNSASANGMDVWTFSSTLGLDHTLVQSYGTASISDNGGNIFGKAPLLGALTDNGGPTMTQLPLPGNPLIDAGDPNFTGPPDYDQRGAGFPRIVNGRLDIGATESGDGDMIFRNGFD